MAKADGLDVNVVDFLEETLLLASSHPNPEPDPESDAQFDEFPGFAPAVRISAAKGLALLTRFTLVSSESVPLAIEQLSQDPVAPVRFQIARYLWLLQERSPELMWRIIEQLCASEQSRSVLSALIGESLGQLLSASEERVAKIAKCILDKIVDGPGAKKVRELCVDVFADLFLWRNHDLGKETVFDLASKPSINDDEVKHIIARLSRSLTLGSVEPVNPDHELVRKRAFELLLFSLQTASNAFTSIQKRNTGVIFDRWPQEDQSESRSLVDVLNYVGTIVHHESGAFRETVHGQTSGKEPLPLEVKKRYHNEIGPIFDALAEVGVPQGLYDLLQMLVAYISIDARMVFLRIGKVLRGGQRGGMQEDSLCIDLFVKLVERYLAEYRSILLHDEECRGVLLECLDIFIKTGWPQATRLAYRFHEVFR